LRALVVCPNRARSAGRRDFASSVIFGFTFPPPALSPPFTTLVLSTGGSAATSWAPFSSSSTNHTFPTPRPSLESPCECDECAYISRVCEYVCMCVCTCVRDDQFAQNQRGCQVVYGGVQHLEGTLHGEACVVFCQSGRATSYPVHSCEFGEEASLGRPAVSLQVMIHRPTIRHVVVGAAIPPASSSRCACDTPLCSVSLQPAVNSLSTAATTSAREERSYSQCGLNRENTVSNPNQEKRSARGAKMKRSANKM
jgi:hypothetical protein